jgi:hypothetical protein
VLVVQACNPGYSGCRDKENLGSKPALGKKKKKKKKLTKKKG